MFFELVKSVLPSDISPAELLATSPETLRSKNPRAALAYALRYSPRLNWEAYRERYFDVKSAEMDPCLHFLRHGVHERVKLISWHPLKSADQEKRPLVSALVVCNNNAIHLRKCLESIGAQTLRDIEIIVVDDGSRDRSPEIAATFASADNRVRLIRNDKNLGTFLSRKRAVLVAKGKYITFIDADDFIAPDACEILYREIIKGYDVVDAGAIVVNTTRADPGEIVHFLKYRNTDNNELYLAEDILREIYMFQRLPWNIWGKMFLREICVAAYTDLAEGYFIRAEDMYGMLAIARIARNLWRINKKVYYYNFGIGFSTCKDLALTYKQWLTLGDTTKAFEEYVNRYSLDIEFQRIKIRHFCISMHRWISSVPDEEAGMYFDMIKEQYGLECVLANLVDNFQNHQGKIANKFQHCVSGRRSVKQTPKHIGIYYHRLSRGAVQTIIRQMAAYLAASGYTVTFFIEEYNQEELELAPEINNVVYIGSGLGDGTAIKSHLLEFQRALAASPVDLMFYATTLVPYMLWDLITLDHYGIPVIACYHNDHNWAFINTDTVYPHHTQEAVLRCAHALTCLSRPSEIYFRMQGINAWYMANPVEQMPARDRDGPIPQQIAVLGRLGDPIKQIGQSLRILKLVAASHPWIRMLLIGSFMTDSQKEECHARARELGVEKNLVYVGRTNDPVYFLKQCGVLLSTSFTEGFPMAIAEAQALGIPCVVYDIPIELARNNESIRKTPQNDIQGAAREIMALFDDSQYWRRLSRIARQAVKAYRPEAFREKMLELTEQYQNYTPWKPADKEDLESVIRYAAFYAGRQRPAKCY